jgi:ubiquinol-cytochrome c reductase cytochrome c subunit
MIRLALVAALAALMLAAPAASGQPPGRLGEQLYAGYCSRCHGPEGRGLDSLGPSLEGVGALAADFYLRTGYMPLESPDERPRRSRVVFSEPELDALIGYVASLGAGPQVPEPHPEEGDVAQGLALFTESCAGCHQVMAEGGYVPEAVAPPLDDATPVQIAEAVRIGPYLMPRFSERQLSDAELDSIVAYVERSQRPVDEGGWGLGHLGPVPEGLVAWLVAGASLLGICLLIGERVRK